MHLLYAVGRDSWIELRLIISSSYCLYDYFWPKILSYHNAFFFAGTLASTIGYGNIAPETKQGKLFCLAFISVGIPYFAYMMSAISDLINAKMDFFRKMAENNLKRTLPYYFIPFMYTFVGLILLIALPSYVFTIMEGISNYITCLFFIKVWKTPQQAWLSWMSLSESRVLFLSQ